MSDSKTDASKTADTVKMAATAKKAEAARPGAPAEVAPAAKAPEPSKPEPPGEDAAPAAPATATPIPDGAPLPKASEGFTDFDLHLFAQGTHWRLWEKFGAHRCTHDGKEGTRFAVWAPHAKDVSVVGDFNAWKVGHTPLHRYGDSGTWVGFVAGLGKGERYKYAIRSAVHEGYQAQKADPFALHFEKRPSTASKVWDLDGYEWGDGEWMKDRAAHQGGNAPMSCYEVHLGSWMRIPEEESRWLTYRELGPRLAQYCKKLGFTHVELLPITEHPFDGSWGYQTTGYFAPTSRFGTPQDFMAFIDTLHQAGIGVILDWVPAHFPRDEHGLGYFDGTHLFEHADPRQGFHKDWGTFIYNFGRAEVRNFLIANALYWLEVFHIDGLRVDAVASMLYLDYSREDGEWVPNQFGGRENLEAIGFLKQLNEVVHEEHPGVVTIAEESTAWPMVSRPTYLGGLGFDMKWNMGWMHDTLEYLAHDPIHRGYHHHKMTFAMMYAFQENFVLAYSHDEVVHGKASMVGKMHGDEWQRFANLRTAFAWQWLHPGKKLLFMGQEFGQWREWDHDSSLDWHLLDEKLHGGLQSWVGDLNRLMRETKALHEQDFHPDGFDWVDCNDSVHSVYSFLRWDKLREEPLLCVFHFTPLVREEYTLGVPLPGRWEEVLNSDASNYGGGGVTNAPAVETAPEPCHDRPWSVTLRLPPLGALVLRPRRSDPVKPFSLDATTEGSVVEAKATPAAEKKSGNETAGGEVSSPEEVPAADE